MLPIVSLAAPKSTADEFIPQDFDVLHYDIDLRIDSLASDTLNGLTLIQLKWLTESEGDFYIDLFGLDIEYIKDIKTQENIDFQIEFDTIDNCEFIHIAQSDSYAEGDTASFEIKYKRKIEESPTRAGLMVRRQIYVLGVGFFDEWVSMGRGWFPCYDHPSDKATFQTTIHTDSELFSAANGLLIADEALGSLRSRSFVMNQQMTTYNATFAIGELKTIEQEFPVYCPEEVYDATAEIVDILPRAVDFFSSIYGDYPFESLAYVMVDEGTIEQQALIMQEKNIVVGDYQNGDTTTLTTIHELAHQWWGNDVSVMDFRDAWLSESFATYSEILWIEHLHGREAAIELNRQKLMDVFSHNSTEQPLWAYDRSRYTNYSLHIYFKGSVVLDMLRYLIGDEAFLSSLRQYQERFGGGNASTADFLSVVEDNAPAEFDLQGFADSYIYGGGYSRLAVETYADGDPATSRNLNMRVRQTEDVLSPMPVEFVIAMQNDSTHHHVAVLEGKESEINLQLPAPYTVNDVRRVYTNHHKYRNKELTSYAWIVDFKSVRSEAQSLTSGSYQISQAEYPVFIQTLVSRYGEQPVIYDMKSQEISPDISAPSAGIYFVRFSSGKVLRIFISE